MSTDSEENIFSLKILQKDFHKYKLLIPLLHIHDIPKELYLKAESEEILNNFLEKKLLNKDQKLREYKVLTIVGSRKNSSYGKDCLEYFLRELKDYPIIIVSGLALGIDTLAHKNAMTNYLPTIAIPGSGLDEKFLYPAANVDLMQNIYETNNLMLSEWEDETKSELYFFPKRNRIMAALSDAILIAEAGEKSGTLITARLGMEYGKNVGVFPNNIFAEASLGSNELIKNGASPITKVEDVLEILKITPSGQQENIFSHIGDDIDENKKINKIVLENLNISDHEKIILEIILQEGNLEKDILLDKLEKENNLSYTESLVALMQLEINGLIKEELGEVRIRK